MEIKACVSGTTIALEHVNDEVFSQRMMGDGIAIQPQEEVIVAPMDGVVKMIFPTHHAIGVANDSVELLIHVGIDTVNLQGKYFKCHVSEGQQVKAGDKLISFKKKKIKKEGYFLDTLMILTKKPNNLSLEVIDHNQMVTNSVSTVLTLNP